MTGRFLKFITELLISPTLFVTFFFYWYCQYQMFLFLSHSNLFSSTNASSPQYQACHGSYASDATTPLKKQSCGHQGRQGPYKICFCMYVIQGDPTWASDIFQHAVALAPRLFLKPTLQKKQTLCLHFCTVVQ